MFYVQIYIYRDPNLYTDPPKPTPNEVNLTDENHDRTVTAVEFAHMKLDRLKRFCFLVPDRKTGEWWVNVDKLSFCVFWAGNFLLCISLCSTFPCLCFGELSFFDLSHVCGMEM